MLRLQLLAALLAKPHAPPESAPAPSGRHRAAHARTQGAADGRPRNFSIERLDEAGARYLDDMCYIKRRGYQEGAKLEAGLTTLMPELKGELPRMARSLVVPRR